MPSTKVDEGVLEEIDFTDRCSGITHGLAHKVLRCPVDAAPSSRFAYSMTNLVGLKALIVLASIFNTYTIHVMFSGHAWAITAQ
jgi:hypothetical protein